MTPISPSAVGVARLAAQYRDMARFSGLIAALLTPFEGIETLLQDMLLQLDPQTAEGVYLDFMGEEVGFPRDVLVAAGGATLDDDTYRVLIQAVGARNRSKGTREDLLAFYEIAVNTTANVIAYGRRQIHVYDSGLQFFDVVISGTYPDAVERVLWPTFAKILKTCGVRVRSVSYTEGDPLFLVGYPGDSPFATVGFFAREESSTNPIPQLFVEELPL